MPTQARPNFFTLLGLHPDASWNQATFERALRQKRGEWSRQSSGVAKKALIAKQNLALIPTITTTMTTPELREKEAQAARQELISDKQAQIEHFEKQLAWLNARDTVDQKEIDQFVNAFQQVVSPDEIRQRITVPLALSAHPALEQETVLDPSLLQSISDRLHVLHMETLYELLQYNRQTATSALLRAMDTLYARMVRLPPSAETTTQIELTGLARRVFQSEESRAEYDASLRLNSLAGLFQELDASMLHATHKDVHQNQVLLFLQNALKEGWQTHEALEKLKEYARQKQWTIIIPALDPVTEKLVCPHCETGNDPQLHHCTTCGQALWINCPRCKTLHTCASAVCDTCGFAIGNRHLVDSLLEELANLLKAGDLQQAQQVVSEAEISWCLGHDRQDQRSQQIIAAKAHIRRLLIVQKDVLEGLHSFDIDEIVIETQRFVQVAWTPPKEGQVIVIQSSQPLQQQGQALSETELEQVGTRLPNVDLESRALDRWQSGVVRYYTPVILWQHNAYIGSSQRHVCVENVSQLDYQTLGSAIRLRWTWPSACQRVLISYHTMPRPWNQGADPTRLHLSRAEYDLLGYYDIRETAYQDYQITLATIMNLDDEQFTSQGTHLLVRTTSKIVVTYEMKPSTLLQKKRQVRLWIDPPTILPPLCIISRQGQLPLHKNDGEVFYRIEAIKTKCQKVIVDLPDNTYPPKTFGKLFFEDDTHYYEFTIHHPRMDQMRLS